MGVYMYNEHQYTGGGGSLASMQDVNISSPTNGQVPTYNSTTQKWENATNGLNIVTTLAVDLTNWTQDTTSQSGTTLYKKSISLSHLYVNYPTVDISAGTGYVLPTSAEQDSYNLIKYATIDTAVPCLYLYATDIPTTAFYIKVVGVD